MPMQLVTMTGLERGRVLPLRDGDIVQLGCSQTLDILTRFRDPDVARVHCEIQVQGRRVLLQDARTTNGTYVNGVRITVEDGSWGLVRASSNKPELVVVVESPVSEQRMRDMFEMVDSVLRTHPEVGEYNQKI